MPHVYSSLGGSIGNLFFYALILIFLGIDIYLRLVIDQNNVSDKYKRLIRVSSIIKAFVAGLLIAKILLSLSDGYELFDPDLYNGMSRGLLGTIFNVIFYIVTATALLLDLYGGPKYDVLSTNGFTYYWIILILPALVLTKILFTSRDIYKTTHSNVREQVRPVNRRTPEQAWNQMAQEGQAADIPPAEQGFIVEQPNESVTGATLNQRVPPPPPAQPKTRLNALVNEAKQGGN